MAVQSTIDKLKDKPKDEKVAVAGGIATTIVIVLLVAWAIFFFRHIQTGSQQGDLGGGVQGQFNFSSASNEQDQLKSMYSSANQDQQDLQDLRNNTSNTSDQMQTQQQTNMQTTETDQFTNTTSN